MKQLIGVAILLAPCWVDAQTAAGFLKPFSADSFTYARLPFQPVHKFPKNPPAGFLKHFSIDSFGYSAAPVMAGYEFSPATTSNSFYNLRGLGCPVCAMGPPNRTRMSLQPFGSKAAVNFWHGRIQLYASLGGMEAWKPDGMMQGIGLRRGFGPVGGINALKPAFPSLSAHWGGAHMLSSDQYNDAWLVQSHLGFRFFLDPAKNISVGMSKGYMYNFSPFGSPGWTSTNADLTITFGNGPARFIARGLRRIAHKRN